ncbi:unnamed protein product [Medioppia subpectinata]|uniref:Methyltransferase type 11 domain-containing protein n=1 Tax=Medioppia subpectinata TaxID=1979941 RepID=A0A7R9KUG4_9ACAR|nr:unnamed protein product [Medioppia subpectinata]CAG2110094.1 unnamed protein product [Medioppia subpectinata]
MSSSLIPKDNHSYNSVDYWDKRYSSVGQGCDGETREYDWLVGWTDIRHIVEKCVPKSAQILMLGCGNSLLSEQMFIDGYHNIHNIDYSAPVIKQMSTHCQYCSRMKWSVMDCLDMKFEDNSFDVVLEKATIDALLTKETNPWHVSQESRDLLTQIMSEMSRVLKLEGQFISISFYGSHFRYPLYKSCSDALKCESRFSMKAIDELGTSFHYYCYSLVKSADKTIELEAKVYEPPKMISGLNSSESIQTIDQSLDTTEVEEHNNYLFNINL